MNSHEASSPSNDNLREWAYAGPDPQPQPDWDLLLSWGMDRGRLRTCVELACDVDCPAARFFLLVLYQWVAQAAKRTDFEILKPMYGEWIDGLRGIRNPKVKRWRYQAKLLLQGLRAFEHDAWFESWAADDTDSI